mmetsp:Transcript_30149/g.72863  ORF Transcript_30149/g.72863 Transcript_30149/m.72863 type:complete len:83 (-) Transcript_30149:298-546(-)
MIYIGFAQYLYLISPMHCMTLTLNFASNEHGSFSLGQNYGILSMNGGAASTVPPNFALKIAGGFPIWRPEANMKAIPSFKAR